MAGLLAVFLAMCSLMGRCATHEVNLAYSIVDRNSSNVAIDHLKPHIQAQEHDDLQLRCVVTLLDATLEGVRLTWIFVPATYSIEDIPSLDDHDVVTLAKDGEVVAPNTGRMRARVRHRWDAVTDYDIEEHFLQIERVSINDEGIFSCQVHSGRGEVLASRHSVVTVQPVPDIGTSPFQGSSGGGVSQDADSSNSKQNPILGPINEAHVTATRGTDVILECRDSDGEEVYWQKQGNPTIVGYGRQLRLPRVERWDSGLYFCSSNTSAPLSHNYTLQVDQAPTVKAPTVALQVVGEAAILSCEVEALPVPQVVWYKLTADDDTVVHPTISAKERLESGEDYSMAISDFKDGFMRASLHITAVQREHYGTYICQARNRLGTDSVEIRLEESATGSRDLSSASSLSLRRGNGICVTLLMTCLLRLTQLRFNHLEPS